MFAEMTGGRADVNRFANAEAALEQIDRATRFQYLLAYEPDHVQLDRSFRRIEITVDRSDATVLYRRGYFAQEPLPFFNMEGVVT